MILIIDFGSQYIQLIVRAVRQCGVYSEVYPFNKIDRQLINNLKPKGIILSGGPASVKDPKAPDLPVWFWRLNLPLLGICYGFQLMASRLGGEVTRSDNREYGRATVKIRESCALLGDDWRVGQDQTVWMSHGDRVSEIPTGFRLIAKSNSLPAIIAHEQRKLYAVQFHPEVYHTVKGEQLIEKFCRRISGCAGNWTMASFIKQAINNIREQAAGEKVILALSGGVDSSVTARLIQSAIGEQLTCVFVDNGLLRLNERQQVEKTFRASFGIKLIVEDASELYLKRLQGVVDPEQKRKIIGHSFIDVFKKVAARVGSVKRLAQGTLYPDVIESQSVYGGPSATIKSHHNVGALPKVMDLELIEPLRYLFKDEVREVGRQLGLPEEIIRRWPFPGPGLAIRLIDQEVTLPKLEVLRQADAIFRQEIERAGLYDAIWQGLVGLLPVRTVGVMGDSRTYEYGCALRAVVSVDGMTAEAFNLPWEVLKVIKRRIINEVRGINRVFYDITSKPPGTIEWE